MKINVGFPEVGMRFIADKDGFSTERGFGFTAIKILKCDVVVSELDGISRSVEIRSRYSEDYDPDTSFSDFEKRANEHILSILAEMNIPG